MITSPLSVDASHSASSLGTGVDVTTVTMRRVRSLSGAPVELIPVIVMTGAGTSPGRVGEEAVEGEKCEHKKI